MKSVLRAVVADFITLASLEVLFLHVTDSVFSWFQPGSWSAVRRGMGLTAVPLEFPRTQVHRYFLGAHYLKFSKHNCPLIKSERIPVTSDIHIVSINPNSLSKSEYSVLHSTENDGCRSVETEHYTLLANR